MAEQQGLIQIYYGDGKGKTTAAFGLAFRCAGWGKKVVIAQFLKSGASGEVKAAERFPELTNCHNLNTTTCHMSTGVSHNLHIVCTPGNSQHSSPTPMLP